MFTKIRNLISFVRSMSVMSVVEYFLDLSDDNKVFNWCVGHTIGPLLLVLIFGTIGSLFGALGQAIGMFAGAWAGFWWYIPRELEVVGAHWLRVGEVRFSTDNLGDMCGPTAILIAASVRLVLVLLI